MLVLFETPAGYAIFKVWIFTILHLEVFRIVFDYAEIMFVLYLLLVHFNYLPLGYIFKYLFVSRKFYKASDNHRRTGGNLGRRPFTILGGWSVAHDIDILFWARVHSM